jgi:chromosome segregation ATPase
LKTELDKLIGLKLEVEGELAREKSRADGAEAKLEKALGRIKELEGRVNELEEKLRAAKEALDTG